MPNRPALPTDASPPDDGRLRALPKAEVHLHLEGFRAEAIAL